MEHIKQIRRFLLEAVFSLAVLTAPIYVQAQNSKSGLVNVDNAIKGFGNLTLGEDISLISNYKLSFMDLDGRPDADGCIKYECHNPDFEAETDLDLDMVGIRTYKNKIVNIYLFFNKENGYQIFQSFVDRYGKCSQRLGNFTYNWNSNDVKLFLGYDSDKSDLGLAVFSSKKLSEEIESAHRQLAAQ